MISVGVLNALMVFKQILEEPKSLGDIHEALIKERRENDIPFLLPGGLEEFVEDEIRDGNIVVVDGHGINERYLVNPRQVADFKRQIEESLRAWETASRKVRNGKQSLMQENEPASLTRQVS